MSIMSKKNLLYYSKKKKKIKNTIVCIYNKKLVEIDVNDLLIISLKS